MKCEFYYNLYTGEKQKLKEKKEEAYKQGLVKGTQIKRENSRSDRSQMFLL